MNTHEYQAKTLLRRYGIAIPDFGTASNLDEVKAIIQKLGLTEAVVKIQVHAGGRGKAGGVKFAKSPEEILKAANALIGMKIVNNQTGPGGIVAQKVLISRPVEIKKEYYVGCVIDRNLARPVFILSRQGGMEIEEIAEASPESILTIPFSADGILKRYQQIRIAKFMGWEKELAQQGAKMMAGLALAFIATDASLLEINPLVESAEGELLALDAKLAVDDSALFRQPELKSFYDPLQLPRNEVMAKEHDLAYIALDGEIGCVVNGAGLAMATMDLIQYYGKKPANFLDVGGSATQERVAEGFKIILSDPKVKAILVNIFGGIMNCGTMAAGIIAAAGELEVKVPLIVRLEGTNVEVGKRLLKDSGLNIITADTLEEAAEKTVKALV